MHLCTLAGSVPTIRHEGTVDAIESSLRTLPNGHTDTPGFVLKSALNMLVLNDLGRALFSPFRSSENSAYMRFLDPAGTDFFQGHATSAGGIVVSARYDGFKSRLSENA
ncbi:MAG: hypothetical protein ACOH2Q_09040 [Rhodococcus sp. (in: high G+C Gram-positive bacteria)]